jgi:hypothetical protein
MSETNKDFALRVLKAMQECDCRDDLWWQLNEDNSKIEFTINCSDMFWWGTADSEDVTPENIGELEKAIADMRALGGKAAEDSFVTFGQTVGQAPLLFVARMRKMRPQGAMYSYLNTAVWNIFDECGPEREPTGANTPRPDFEEQRVKEVEWEEKRKQIGVPRQEVKADECKPNIVQRAFMWIVNKLEE